MTLPTSVVETDNQLETTAERTRQKLAEHRWHWTLDESNPNRVSIREYARSIGRDMSTVRDMVNGYVAWSEGGAPPTEFGDFQARAKMRGETLTATEAVAQAKGIGIEATRRHHAEEVREVKATAAERAERRGTTPAEEVHPVAEHREQARRAAKRVTEDKKSRHTLRYLQAEGKISTAMRSLRELLNDTEGVEFSSEERELIASSLGQLRALLNLLDVQIVGTADIDWDAEMKKLGQG